MASKKVKLTYMKHRLMQALEMASKKVKLTYMKHRLMQALETGGLSRDLGSAIRQALSIIDSHARKIRRLEAVEAAQRVEIVRLQAALKPFAEVARGIPREWPDDCRLRVDFNEHGEWLAYHAKDSKEPMCLPTIAQWRAAKAGGCGE